MKLHWIYVLGFGLAALVVASLPVRAESLPPLLNLPNPFLGSMDEAVERQIGAARERVESLVASAAPVAGELAEAFGRLGQLYLLYDLEPAAEPCFTNAGRLAPEEFRWLYYLGAIAQNQRRLDEAEELLRTALELKPGDLPARLRLADVLLARNRPADAREELAHAMRLDPRSAAAHDGLGRAAAALGELEAAIGHFQAALALKPEASSLHYHLALAYRDLGDVERARQHMATQGKEPVRFPDPLIRELLESMAGVGGHLVLGRKALQEGSLDVAAAEFRQAIAADPSNAEAHSELAQVLARRGEVEEAIEHFRGALANAPELSTARFNLARALASQGRHGEALQESDRLVASDPQSSAFAIQRAKILKQLGRQDEARQQLARIAAAHAGDEARQRQVDRSELALAPANAEPGADMAGIADKELERRSAARGSQEALFGLFPQNLEAYYAVYKLPGDETAISRLIRTGQLVTADFVSNLYLKAQENAVAAGAGAISAEHLGRAARLLLPAESGADQVSFFPAAPAAERLPVEIYDLEAMSNSWFPWMMVRSFADGLPPDGLPLSDAAVMELARSIGAYALVVFRLAGREARESYAPYLRTRHVRGAVKTVAARAAARSRGEDEAIAAAPPAGDFVDVTAASGITFRHRSSEWISRFRREAGVLPTFSGGGVSAADVDGDGWEDLVFCGGDGCALYRNQRDGTFADDTAASGIHHPGEARMAVVADFDNDGDRDLFLTYARDTNRLYRNEGGGTFADVTRDSGLLRDGDISGPAIAVDVDNDGLLDVYVGNFGNYLEGASPWLSANAKNGQPNRLYRNLGGLRFRDVTAETGTGDTGWSQALSHVDFDRDGDQDLYVANDFGRNELLVNQGDGIFLRGAAATGSDDPFHGMNTSFADLNEDGHAEIFVTNIWAENPAQGTLVEHNTLLVSERWENGVRYRSQPWGDLREPDTGWSWAALFFDYDNDGDDDLYCVNGLNGYFTFSLDRRHPARPELTYPYNNDREANLFYRNENGGFVESSAASGASFSDANSRGLALLDSTATAIRTWWSAPSIPIPGSTETTRCRRRTTTSSWSSKAIRRGGRTATPSAPRSWRGPRGFTSGVP